MENNERLLDKLLCVVLPFRDRLLKQDGEIIYIYPFRLFFRQHFIMTSSTKWRKGEYYHNTPIWTNKIGGELPTLFIGKLAIGYEPKRKNSK